MVTIWTCERGLTIMSPNVGFWIVVYWYIFRKCSSFLYQFFRI
jgi:hypothetical protein